MVDSDKKIQPPEIRMPQPLQNYQIDAGYELRIDKIKDHIKVQLVSGIAEVFGRELPLEEPIFFHCGENIAIFCWKESQIKISGIHEAYPSDQTPMNIYVNISYALNQLRETARLQKDLAPGLLITGSQLSGKSTLTKILTNYSLKLGWSPVYIDLDLTSNEISPPGSISGALVSETLPSEFLKEVITYFHGSLTPITQEFFYKQISELASAVNAKLQGDLDQFNHIHGDKNELVAPSQPELFASGVIVNGFTPSNKSETETLCKAIKLLNVQVILIIDNEKLEKEISMCLKSYPNSQKYKVIKVPKSPGIQSHHRLSAEETSTKLYEAYLDYFKGRFSEIFSKSATWREMIQMPNYLRRELDPQPVSIVLEKIRIFEVKGLEIDLSALPAGSTQTEWTTVIDYIRPADFESNFSKHSGKILANLKPRDAKLLMQLDSQIAQNPSHVTLSVEFQEMLLTASASEFVQIKEIKIDKNTQKRFLEVVRTCEVEEDDQQNGDNWIGFQTNYFLMSNF